jgi:hypothetical protein
LQKITVAKNYSCKKLQLQKFTGAPSISYFLEFLHSKHKKTWKNDTLSLFSSFFAIFCHFSSKIFYFLTRSTCYPEYSGYPRFWVLGSKWATLLVKI